MMIMALRLDTISYYLSTTSKQLLLLLILVEPNPICNTLNKTSILSDSILKTY